MTESMSILQWHNLYSPVPTRALDAPLKGGNASSASLTTALLPLPATAQRTKGDHYMRRLAIISTILALAIAPMAMGGTPVQAGSKASPPQSSAYGKSLPEWMQLYFGWLLGGGANHVGHVQFLPLPNGTCTGAFTYANPGTCV